MDLNQLDTQAAASKGAWLHLRHPVTGDLLFDDPEQKKPMRIELLGADSKEYRGEMHRTKNERLREVQGEGVGDRPSQDAEARAVAIAAVCTRAFENIKLNGVALVCTPEIAITVYTKFDWIFRQVSSFIENRKNFPLA